MQGICDHSLQTKLLQMPIIHGFTAYCIRNKHSPRLKPLNNPGIPDSRPRPGALVMEPYMAMSFVKYMLLGSTLDEKNDAGALLARGQVPCLPGAPGDPGSDLVGLNWVAETSFIQGRLR